MFDNPQMSYLLPVLVFTFAVHLIGTLSYAVRLVGVTTGRIAVSFALFNVLVLVSRMSNSFQSPLIAKMIENDLARGLTELPLHNFQYFILAATAGTAVGAFLIPTFQRIFGRFVLSFNVHRSVPKVLIHGFSKAGVRQLRDHFRVPRSRRLNSLAPLRNLPFKILAMNVLSVAILTVGVFAALFAGYINPEFRGTASQLSAVVNGFATVLLFVFIDPYLSALTDDVIQGSKSEGFFRKCVIALVISRFAGTIVAQFILLPAAYLIAWVAGII